MFGSLRWYIRIIFVMKHNQHTENKCRNWWAFANHHKKINTTILTNIDIKKKYITSTLGDTVMLSSLPHLPPHTAWVITILRMRSVAMKLVSEFRQASVEKGFDQKDWTDCITQAQLSSSLRGQTSAKHCHRTHCTLHEHRQFSGIILWGFTSCKTSK